MQNPHIFLCLVLFVLFWKLGQDPLYRVGGQGKSNQEACLETNSDNKQKQLRFDHVMSSVSDEEIITMYSHVLPVAVKFHTCCKNFT